MPHKGYSFPRPAVPPSGTVWIIQYICAKLLLWVKPLSPVSSCMDIYCTGYWHKSSLLSNGHIACIYRYDRLKGAHNTVCVRSNPLPLIPG
ncbi:hypothetical protein GDO78_012064 [Eleutherodactylus coqui]|uniref:Uncharacterized protein n=1 Tax=Eleutherodactylus coqui TaxID=57060 RepID=A0A8J6F4W6_ELECQ|nr:hypothetical protein GDO78_012064 [Eleutherodactylus coqui]